MAVAVLVYLAVYRVYGLWHDAHDLSPPRLPLGQMDGSDLVLQEPGGGPEGHLVLRGHRTQGHGAQRATQKGHGQP